MAQEHPEAELVRSHLAHLQRVAAAHVGGVFALVLLLRDPATFSMGVTDLRWDGSAAEATIGDAMWLALQLAPSTSHRLSVALREGQVWCLVIGPVSARVMLVDLNLGDVTG